VRALSGAIVQRTTENLALQGHAQNIIAVTDQIQEGIRHILQRLRPLGSDSTSLNQALQRYLMLWRQQYPDITLNVVLCTEPLQVSDEMSQAVLRIIQEGLTNVVRHAAATQVSLKLSSQLDINGYWLELTLADNGRGLSCETASNGGFGLTGIRERVAALYGELAISSIMGGGACLRARFPTNHVQTNLN
jgi:two-component system sensor histidine kinase UhpB